MTVVTARHDRTLSLSIDVDQLARYGSGLALGSAILAAAGVLSVVTYLSAWDVPAPVVRLDPLTAALRSESVVYQFVVLTALVFGVDAVLHRLAGRRWIRIASGAAGGTALIVLAIDLLLGGFVGPIVTIAGGIGLAVIHARRPLSQRTRLVTFAVIALVAAFQTGVESGRLIRDDARWQTPIVLTSRVPVGGLDGGLESGGAWQYPGLYLVFRDGEAVYVSRPGAGAVVWVVPAMHVMSLGIGKGA